ncbi:MAG: glycosyltransferase family 39 protein [Nitrosopumilus sp.]|nr:glycosyltransferase family 39 protein [Nitrosopumilus sp.]
MQKSDTDARQGPARRRTVAILSVIAAVALGLRLAYVDPGVHLTGDAVEYLRYGMDAARQGALPADWTPQNNGFPAFMSLFFSGDLHSNMLAQRLATVSLSAVTVAPIYSIARRFLPAWPALIAPVIFAVEPQIAWTAQMGLLEAPFALLVTSALACFLSGDRRVALLAFPLLSIATLVRGEGNIVLITFFIFYAVRFRRYRRTVPELLLALFVVALILAPMMSYRTEINGTDSIFDRTLLLAEQRFSGIAGAGIQADADAAAQPGASWEPRPNTLLMLGELVLLPVMLLVPYGLYRTFKMEARHATVSMLFLLMIVISIAVMSYGWFISRYLFWMVPLSCVLATFAVWRLSCCHRRRDLAALAVTGVIVASSAALLEERPDYGPTTEWYGINGMVLEAVGGGALTLQETRPLLYPLFLDGDGLPARAEAAPGHSSHRWQCGYPDSDCSDTPGRMDVAVHAFRASNYTHIVVDGSEERRSHLLIDAFNDPGSYPYLTKVYDSTHHGFSYRVKVFEIDHRLLPPRP